MRKRLLCALLLGLAITACGKQEENESETEAPKETVVVTEIDMSPPQTEQISSFDKQVSDMYGKTPDYAEESENIEKKKENSVTSDSKWRYGSCEAIKIDDVTYEYGMSVAEFLVAIGDSSFAESYSYPWNANAMVSTEKGKDGEYVIHVSKNGEQWFDAVFLYPKGQKDVISIERMVLARIDVSNMCEEYAKRGENFAYKDIRSVNYDNFESFLWENVVPHEEGFELKPKVVNEESGEVYESLGELRHAHSYVSEDGESVEETEDCEIKKGKCEKCSYVVPDVKYEKETQNDTIVVTYKHSGSDSFAEASRWSGYSLYLPTAYDVVFEFSMETRELRKFSITLDSKVSKDVPKPLEGEE